MVPDDREDIIAHVAGHHSGRKAIRFFIIKFLLAISLAKGNLVAMPDFRERRKFSFIMSKEPEI